ncbi:MAG: hypothetical protein ACI8Q1_001638 [Parvicella sp.]|jgi:hypothetical protein
MKNILLLYSIILLPFFLEAQIHCGVVELVPNTTVSEVATFDDFTDYEGGVIMNSVAKIRVNVEDKAIIDPLCSWSLTMTVSNNPGAGTPAGEWEELAQYGSGTSANPSIDALEIRVRNSCATSPNNGVFQTFTNNADIIDIIASMLLITPAGACATNVNGPGNHLTNYNEFNFDIDIRIKPGFAFNPGIFQLNITFHLEENP